jgi:hypothetical protein
MLASPVRLLLDSGFVIAVSLLLGPSRKIIPTRKILGAETEIK